MGLTLKRIDASRRAYDQASVGDRGWVLVCVNVCRLVWKSLPILVCSSDKLYHGDNKHVMFGNKGEEGERV